MQEPDWPVAFFSAAIGWAAEIELDRIGVPLLFGLLAGVCVTAGMVVLLKLEIEP